LRRVLAPDRSHRQRVRREAVLGKFEDRQKKIAALMKKVDLADKEAKLAVQAKASGDKVKAALQKAQAELKTAED
jgi:hypothetical protein